jgi:hypothetical protein
MAPLSMVASTPGATLDSSWCTMEKVISVCLTSCPNCHRLLTQYASFLTSSDRRRWHPRQLPRHADESSVCCGL